MSTPGSRRLRLSLQAIGAVALVYLVVVTGLQLFVRRVEATGVVYPYRQEDWLRYLLPTLWPDDGQPLLLLTGPSTVREDLLVEEFDAAFPTHRAFQGGISAGTLTDVMRSLAYVEQEYGAGALPDVMVIGFSPRFMAEIPEDRPFAMGLDRYSPNYRVPDDTPTSFALERKSALAGAAARVRFMLLKQHERYATAGHWLTSRVLGPELDVWLRDSRVLQSAAARLVLPPRARRIGLHAYALERTSPYKYRGAGPEVRQMFLDQLDDADSYWPDVFAWDAADDAVRLHQRISHLRAFAARHEIELYVVNLPEGSANRTRYRPEHFEAYLATLTAAFDTVPLLDLRCLLDDDMFLDAEHALLRGARLVTERVIGFMQEVRAARAGGAADPVMSRDIAARHAAAACPEPAEGKWAN